MSTKTQRGMIPPATVRASLANGFQVFSDDLVPLLVMGFAITVLGGLCRTPWLLVETGGQYVSVALTLLIASPLELGMSFVCLRAVRSGTVNFEHLIAVFGRYGSMVVASSIMFLILPGAFALLVLPGIAFFCATRFVPFLLLEDELSGAEAIIESIKLSGSCFWQLLGICTVGLIATAIGGISILGLVPALLWWNLSLASLYHSIARPPEGWALEDQEELERRAAEALEDDEDDLAP